MGDCKNDVDRLLRLYKEAPADQEYDDEEDEKEVDMIAARSDDSDTEQEWDEFNNKCDRLTHRTPMFPGKEGTIWRNHCAVRNVQTRQQNIVKTFPGVKTARILKSPLDIWSTRFDDIEMRNERRALGKLAPIRDLLDVFVQHCKEAYSHSQFITIDEKLEAFRGNCSFIQYIPSKPN